MPMDANSYFQRLQVYLNVKQYGKDKRDARGRIKLQETIYLSGGRKEKKPVSFKFSGEVILFKLDRNKNPLFHFFNNENKPWSKRCDYVIFQLWNRKIYAYCIEFKSASLPKNKTLDQLNASAAWCKAVHSIINIYTGEKKQLTLKKFVFSCMEDPSQFIDQGGYLNSDCSVKHYHYNDLDNMRVEELENENLELVR